MIARAWWGRTSLDNADDYVLHLRAAVLPELGQINGHRGAYVLRREVEGSVEFAVLTLWESMDAIREFAGENPEVAVVPPEAQELLSHYDETVTHYEVAVEPETSK